MKSGILILEQIRTGMKDIISFRLVDKAFTKQKAIKFFTSKLAREAKYKEKNGEDKNYRIEAEFSIYYDKRSLGQNKLLRSLERVMSFEQYGEESFAKDFHEGLIEVYCPDTGRPNPITGRVQKKRTSDLNTVEMANVIGGAFMELANMGVEITSSNIANYWIEWYNYRGKQGYDPFTEKARTIEEYKRAVPVCEACMKGLRTTDEYGKECYEGQMAHIVSRGSGGCDEVWNIMHLCTKCHLTLQHQKGWLFLIKVYPHIAYRVAMAQIESGGVASISADPDYAPVMKEVNRIKKYRDSNKKENN